MATIIVTVEDIAMLEDIWERIAVKLKLVDRYAVKEAQEISLLLLATIIESYVEGRVKAIGVVHTKGEIGAMALPIYQALVAKAKRGTRASNGH